MLVAQVDQNLLSLTSAPTFLLERNANGTPVFAAVNTSWTDMTGCQAVDMIGNCPDIIWPGRTGTAISQHYAKAFQTGVPQTYHTIFPTDDRVLKFQTTLTPVPDDTGQVHQVVGVTMDQTTEMERDELLSKDTATTHDIEQFIALAAHDLRAPLRNIHHLADMLREDFHDHGDGKLQLIDALEDVASKAMILLSDVLAHAQATDAVEMQKEFNFEDLCHDVFAMLDPLGGHSLTAVSQRLSSDETAIQIALRNLCENALKHSGKASTALIVCVNKASEGMIEITVSDDGTGFKDPALIFLDGGKLRIDSGFGLMGVRRLISARGGTITAENLKDGKGSMVRFTLPGRFV